MKFRSQIISLSLFSMVLIAFIVLMFSRKAFQETLLEEKLTSLNSQCDYLAETDLIHHFEEIDLYSKEHKVRVTLIDNQGKVFYDSETNPEDMDNHYYRNEIKKAREFGKGSEVRFSNTLKIETIYFAKYVDNDFFVRVATPLNLISVWDKAFSNRIIPLILLILFVLILINLVVIFYVSRPLKKLDEACKEYQNGNLKFKTSIETPKEFHDLSSTMNEMARTLDEQVIKISKDRNLYSLILRSMAEGILVLDTNKNVLMMNESSKEMLNIEDYSEIKTLQIFGDVELELLIDQIIKGTKAIGSKEVIKLGHLHGETALLMGEGKQKIYNINLSPIYNETTKKINGLVMTVIDITELKRVEKIKKDFVANVSHELKTPLTSINGFSEIIVNSPLDDVSIKKYSKIINRNANQMKGIIDDLLVLASLEDNKTKLVMVFSNIGLILEESIESVGFKSKEKNIKIENNYKGNEQIYCNPSLLTQAIINLLNNAINYSDENKTIIISVNSSPKILEISIKDQGWGISYLDQQRIFERFYRVDKTRSRDTGGTGLGLSIVKHICILHSGSIKVNSVVNQGSEFIITLPKEQNIENLKDKEELLYPNF